MSLTTPTSDYRKPGVATTHMSFCDYWPWCDLSPTAVQSETPFAPFKKEKERALKLRFLLSTKLQVPQQERGFYSLLHNALQLITGSGRGKREGTKGPENWIPMDTYHTLSAAHRNAHRVQSVLPARLCRPPYAESSIE